MSEELELTVGVTYRGKRAVKNIHGEYNDRTIVWMNYDRTKVQYDGIAVAFGRRLPTVSREAFLNWAGSIAE